MEARGCRRGTERVGDRLRSRRAGRALEQALRAPGVGSRRTRTVVGRCVGGGVRGHVENRGGIGIADAPQQVYQVAQRGPGRPVPRAWRGACRARVEIAGIRWRPAPLPRSASISPTRIPRSVAARQRSTTSAYAPRASAATASGGRQYHDDARSLARSSPVQPAAPLPRTPRGGRPPPRPCPARRQLGGAPRARGPPRPHGPGPRPHPAPPPGRGRLIASNSAAIIVAASSTALRLRASCHTARRFASSRRSTASASGSRSARDRRREPRGEIDGPPQQTVAGVGVVTRGHEPVEPERPQRLQHPVAGAAAAAELGVDHRGVDEAGQHSARITGKTEVDGESLGGRRARSRRRTPTSTGTAAARSHRAATGRATRRWLAASGAGRRRRSGRRAGRARERPESRPAASSIASGSPSRRRTMSATNRSSAGGRRGDRGGPGGPGRGRPPPRLPARVPDRCPGSASGDRRNVCSAVRPSGSPDFVASTVDPGAGRGAGHRPRHGPHRSGARSCRPPRARSGRRGTRRRPRGRRLGRPAGSAPTPEPAGSRPGR